MPPVSTLTICVLTQHEALARVVGETLGEWLPGCVVRHATTPEDDAVRGAACVLLDATLPTDASVVGSTAPVVLLVDRAADASGEVRPAGVAAAVPVAAVPQVLAGVVVAAMAERGSTPAVDAARGALEETRRLIARGRTASAVQHAANNPLTALLTEAQLMEMDPLPPEQLAAVRRMVELSRRVAATLRRLDAPRDTAETS